jgi:hypothetical protein
LISYYEDIPPIKIEAPAYKKSLDPAQNAFKEKIQ